jgi:TPR repeat protein
MCAVALDIPVPAGFIDSACQPSPSQSLVKYVLDALDSSDYPDIFVENNSSSENPSALEIFSSGLLHAAAILGIDGAYQSLGYRYSSGVGVTVDDETAAFYYNAAVGTASQHFHVVGGQPIVESDRIDDHTAKSVVIGNAGGDDELIQHQILRADEGHIPSALASADLYYYGARGLPRDQQRALTYYRMAAEKGDLQGLCGAANMYLKGEGTVDGEKNTTEAIRLYELAVEGGSVSAMNGLGYVYFYGQVSGF